MFYNIANRNCKCLRNGGFIHNNYIDFPIPGTYFLYSICQYMYNWVKVKISQCKVKENDSSKWPVHVCDSKLCNYGQKKPSKNIMDSTGIIMEAGGSTFFSSKLHKINKNNYSSSWISYNYYPNIVLIMNTKGQVTLLRNLRKSYQTFKWKSFLCRDNNI